MDNKLEQLMLYLYRGNLLMINKVIYAYRKYGGKCAIYKYDNEFIRPLSHNELKNSELLTLSLSQEFDKIIRNNFIQPNYTDITI